MFWSYAPVHVTPLRAPGGRERMGNPADSDEIHFYTPAETAMALLSNINPEKSDIELFGTKVGMDPRS